MSPGIVALVLGAALLHATWNALVKTGGDRLAVLALTIGLPALAVVPALFLLPAPARESWPYLAGSGLTHWLYFACLLGAYRHGDLSQVYPIARGTAPLLVAFGAWLAVGEALGGLELAGIAILSGGLLSLAWRGRGPTPAGGTAALVFAFLTSLSIGAYSLIDGIGVRLSGAPLSYILWMFLVVGTPFLGFAFWARRGRFRASFGPGLKAGAGAAAISSLAYGTVIWVMSLAPMAHVVALRETSVIMAAAIGALALREPFGRRRIAAAAVIAFGAALLQLG